MPLPERIEGDGVYLRPVRPEEARTILEGALPAHLRSAEGYPGEFSLEVMDIFAGERSADAEGFTPFFIVRSEDNAIVGEIGWSTPDGPAAPVAGYDVIEPLWGRGYASAALSALIRHLFTLEAVHRVCADTTSDHVASRRVMEKCGMRLVREETQEVDGELQQVVFYEIEKPARSA